MDFGKARVEKELARILHNYHRVSVEDIPNIDLYMDQVTTFMEERLRHVNRDPREEKIMTKTMINNYVKNRVLLSPVRKKYGRDHVLLLILIYYFKSILSIGDIQKLIAPVMDRYAVPTSREADQRGREGSLTMAEIYNEIFAGVEDQLPQIGEDCRRHIAIAEKSFAHVPEKDRVRLQRFNLICQLSADVYAKKLLIERLLDEEPQPEPEKKRKP